MCSISIETYGADRSKLLVATKSQIVCAISQLVMGAHRRSPSFPYEAHGAGHMNILLQ